MSNSHINEFRRTRRRKVGSTVNVIDTMTDMVIGRLGNISETGMLMMMGSVPLTEDALYQLRINIQEGDHTTPIEVGAHLLWQEKSDGGSQAWIGFRFISMSEQEMLALRQWIDAPGANYV